MKAPVSPTSSFEDLIVWRKAHALTLAVYKFTAGFPADERFGLTSQFRRAAVSIAANIAEGYRKRGCADKIRFLNVAEGALSECRYYLLLARDLGYGDPSSLIADADDIGMLLTRYAQGISRGAEGRKSA